MEQEQDKINKGQTEENANTNRNIGYVASSLNQSNQLQGVQNKLQEHINGEVEEKLKAHDASLLVANHEMGLMHREMEALKTDVAWIREGFASMDKKVWAIVAGILVSIGMSIMNLLK